MKKEALFFTALLMVLTTASQSESKEKPSGKTLAENKGCLHCHFIEGDGGFLGPPLDGIGKYRNKKQIVDILSTPSTIKLTHEKSIPAKELMNHVLLSKQEATQIADYLVTIPDAKLKVNHPDTGLKLEKLLPKGFKFTPHKPTRASKKGFKLFKKNGCMACHSVKGKGGKLGPALDGVGARRSRFYIENRIKGGAIIIYDSKKYKPSEYSMPASKLKGRHIDKITEYLLTLPEEDI